MVPVITHPVCMEETTRNMVLPFRLQRLLPVAVLIVFGLYVLTGSRIRTVRLPVPQAPLSDDDDLRSPAKPPAGASSPEQEQEGPPQATQQSLAPGKKCPPEIEHLRSPELGLSGEAVLYTRRCIKPVWVAEAGSEQRNMVTQIQGPLIEQQTTVNLTSCTYEVKDIGWCEPIMLHVPPTYPEHKYPHLLFGLSTDYGRLQESLSAFSHWLSGSDAQVLAVVVDAELEGGLPKDLKALEELYAASKIKLRCLKPRRPSLTVDQYHFTMIEDLLEAVTPETRWLGLLDDDTFFPSLYRMDEELSKHNHTQPAWLGALSEDLSAIRNWGIMAFGGAGVFLSLPLARELVPRIDICLANAHRPTGDAILRDCIFTETHTKLTMVQGLYQHDIRGDVSGFYESGVRPLSLHHWKSWYHEPMEKMAAVVSLCGDCFLQRWRFGEDTLFANGYSITRYPDGGLSRLDLTRMETTWISAGIDFDWSVGPLRPRLEDGKKKSYKIRDVQVTDNGDFRQIYVYKGDGESQELDEVVELVWKS